MKSLSNLTREDKVWCAAIAKFQSMSADQRAKTLSLAEERLPIAVLVLSSPIDAWSDDVQQQIKKAQEKAATK